MRNGLLEIYMMIVSLNTVERYRSRSWVIALQLLCNLWHAWIDLKQCFGDTYNRCCYTSQNQNMESAQCITTPYTITLTKMEDFLRLEKVLRHLLQCQGPTCSFLQSADYVLLKLAATYALRGSVDTTPPPKPVYIPQSTLSIHLMEDKHTIVIREHAAVVGHMQSSNTQTKKRKFKATKAKPDANDDVDPPSEGEGEVVFQTTIPNNCDDSSRDIESQNDLKYVSGLENNFMLAKKQAALVIPGRRL